MAALFDAALNALHDAGNAAAASDAAAAAAAEGGGDPRPVYQQSIALARVASVSVHALAMHLHARCADYMIHSSVAGCFQELANIADGPGGQGLRLCQVVSTIGYIFQAGVIRIGNVSVLGACFQPLSEWHKHAEPVAPVLVVHPVIRWTHIGPVAHQAALAGLADCPVYVHMASCVCGTYMVRLRRLRKIVISQRVTPDYIVAHAPTVDVSDAMAYARQHAQGDLREGIDMANHDDLHVRTVVRDGVLVRLDVVV